MCEILKEIMRTEGTKVEDLPKNTRDTYEIGLNLLGILSNRIFLDIPRLPAEKYSVDGIFYNIPYLENAQLWEYGNEVTLLVVYNIEKRTSYCPFRISFKLTDKDNFEIMFNYQDDRIVKKVKKVKKVFIGKEKGEYYTETRDYGDITLKEIVNFIFGGK